MTAVTWLAGPNNWRTRGRDPIPHGLGHGGTPPTPGPDLPAPASWQAAIDTGSVAQVALWYEAHTGHDGINPDDPNDLPLDESDLTWVDGGLKSTHDGQVFEGLHSNHIRIAHNNVTVRRCRITNGALYGAYFNPTNGGNYTGALIEFVTFDAPGKDTSPVFMNPAETPEGQPAAVIRYCEAIGWDGGFKTRNRVHLEYLYVHDQWHPPGVHSTAAIQRGRGGRVHRCLLTDGTSNILGIYMKPSYGYANDITYSENIVGGAITMPDGRVISPESSGSYHFQIGGDEEYGPAATDLRIVDNMLYGGSQYGLFTGSGVRWGEDGNERSGNWIFETFTTHVGHATNEQTFYAGDLAPFND